MMSHNSTIDHKRHWNREVYYSQFTGLGGSKQHNLRGQKGKSRQKGERKGERDEGRGSEWGFDKSFKGLI